MARLYTSGVAGRGRDHSDSGRNPGSSARQYEKRSQHFKMRLQSSSNLHWRSTLRRRARRLSARPNLEQTAGNLWPGRFRQPGWLSGHFYRSLSATAPCYGGGMEYESPNGGSGVRLPGMAVMEQEINPDLYRLDVLRHAVGNKADQRSHEHIAIWQPRRGCSRKCSFETHGNRFSCQSFRPFRLSGTTDPQREVELPVFRWPCRNVEKRTHTRPIKQSCHFIRCKVAT